MVSFVEHARRELDLIEEDAGYAASLVAAVAAFTSWPHSGDSHMAALRQLRILLKGGTLSPLTDDPAEWEDRSGMSGYPVWQNVRCTSAMSTDGGRTFYLLPGTAQGSVPLTRDMATEQTDPDTGHRLWRTAPVKPSPGAST